MDEEEKPVINGDRMILDWPEAEIEELLQKMQSQLPKNDQQNFRKRMNKLDWANLTVGEHSSEECRAQWEKIQSNVSTCLCERLFFVVAFWFLSQICLGTRLSFPSRSS